MPEGPAGGGCAALVEVVDKVADDSSGTFGVRLNLPNPDNRLPASFKCGISFFE